MTIYREHRELSIFPFALSSIMREQARCTIKLILTQQLLPKLTLQKQMYGLLLSLDKASEN